MANRLTRIYTRTGDDGSTGIDAKTRLPKNAPRIVAMGSVDELNSQIGLLLTESLPDDARALLVTVQHRLFDLGGELAMPDYQTLKHADIAALETAIDGWNAGLSPLREFILPGGCRAGALCHVARTVCRRAECDLVALHHATPLRSELLAYVNRLSDLLFVLARSLNHSAGQEITYWQKPD